MTSVLIVDDEWFMFSVIEHLFAKIGCEVSYANDGKEALEILEGHGFDIIFCDGNMPGMNGLDFVKEFRKQDQHTPIVVISNDDILAKFMLEHGATTTIEKHFIFKYLKTWIEKE